MFEHSSVSLVHGMVILAGVVLLVTSVFHPVLMWLAVVSLALGFALLLAECVGFLLFSKSAASSAATPAVNPPTKES